MDARLLTLLDGVPRACGDEPVTVELDGYPASVFPAPAGMNRSPT